MTSLGRCVRLARGVVQSQRALARVYTGPEFGFRQASGVWALEASQQNIQNPKHKTAFPKVIVLQPSLRWRSEKFTQDPNDPPSGIPNAVQPNQLAPNLDQILKEQNDSKNNTQDAAVKAELRGDETIEKVSKPKEDIWNIPNLLAMSRIALMPVLCWSVYTGNAVVAITGTVYCAFSDWLDGWLARRWNQQTEFGAKLDPLGDKIIMAGLVTTLTYTHALPLMVFIAVVGRDLLLVGGYFVFRWWTMPQPKKFMDLFNLNKAEQIEIKPTMLSKANTVLQFGLITTATLTMFVESEFLRAVVVPNLSWVVVATTVASGLHYALTMKGIKTPAKAK